MLDLLSRLVRRDAPRTEADVQADVRQLFLTAPFHLEEGDIENVYLESPLGDRRRIDVEVGSTVVEVKRDLRRGKVKAEAVEQLAGYVERRAEQTGRRYVGSSRRRNLRRSNSLRGRRRQSPSAAVRFLESCY